jgi:hypothetical protein
MYAKMSDRMFRHKSGEVTMRYISNRKMQKNGMVAKGYERSIKKERAQETESVVKT